MSKGRNIALTGVPRSGTTLCCRLLGEAVQTVALFEPMDVQRLPHQDRAAALDQVEAFFAMSRRSLVTSGRAFSNQIGGSVPDNPFGQQRDSQGRRMREAVLGEIVVDKPLGDDFTLVVKHNAAFTALLPELAQGMEAFAVVRNPLAVLASWHSVDLPVSHGRLPAGERLDVELSSLLDSLDDVLERQIAILDWFFERYATALPRERVMAYEAVIHSGGEELALATGLPVPRMPLTGRNASKLYDSALAWHLAERLLARGGGWHAFYCDAEIEALAKLMAAGD